MCVPFSKGRSFCNACVVKICVLISWVLSFYLKNEDKYQETLRIKGWLNIVRERKGELNI